MKNRAIPGAAQKILARPGQLQTHYGPEIQEIGGFWLSEESALAK